MSRLRAAFSMKAYHDNAKGELREHGKEALNQTEARNNGRA